MIYHNINVLAATPRERIDKSETANSDIALWSVHDKTRQNTVQKGRAQNTIATLTLPEDLAVAHISDSIQR